MNALLLSIALLGQAGYEVPMLVPAPGYPGPIAAPAPIEMEPARIPVLQLPGSTWDAIARVQCNDGCAGSGVLVKDGDTFAVLTAAHVVRSASSATVTFRGGKRLPSKAIFTNADRSDSAAIVIDDPGIAPVPIATKSPAPGETIMACGYGGSGNLIGQPNSYVGQAGQDIEMRGKIRSGDSGGPVFNSAGEIVGLNSASEAPGQSGVDNYCCSWHPLKEFLGRVKTRLYGQVIGESSCPGGVCPQPYSPPQYSQPRPRPQGDVAPPPSVPSQPSQPATIDYEKLASMVAAKIPRPKDGRDGNDGKNGEAGPAGPQGPAGATGPAGKDGKDADLSGAGFWVQTLDHAGKPFGEKKFVRLGQTLEIKPLAIPATK